MRLRDNVIISFSIRFVNKKRKKAFDGQKMNLEAIDFTEKGEAFLPPLSRSVKGEHFSFATPVFIAERLQAL
jgi:hypothetical protein